MTNIKDYLIPIDNKSIFDIKRLSTNIVEIDVNPFYLPLKGDDRKHFELRIQFVGNYYRLDEVPDGDTNEEININEYPITFKMTTYGVPSIEKFSEHIKKELLDTIDAMEIEIDRYNNSQFDFELNNIDPKHIYNFLKNINKDHTNTEDFLKDYDHYKNRLYHNLKFIYSLTFGKNYVFARTFSGKIGLERMLGFLYE